MPVKREILRKDHFTIHLSARAVEDHAVPVARIVTVGDSACVSPCGNIDHGIAGSPIAVSCGKYSIGRSIIREFRKTAVADICAAVASCCRNDTAGDRDIAAIAVRTTADARTGITAERRYRSAGDRNVPGRHQYTCALTAAADARTAVAAGCRHNAAGNGDIAAVIVIIAANTRTFAAGCRHNTAGNGNIAVAAAKSAADA